MPTSFSHMKNMGVTSAQAQPPIKTLLVSLSSSIVLSAKASAQPVRPAVEQKRAGPHQTHKSNPRSGMPSRIHQ